MFQHTYVSPGGSPALGDALSPWSALSIFVLITRNPCELYGSLSRIPPLLSPPVFPSSLELPVLAHWGQSWDFSCPALMCTSATVLQPGPGRRRNRDFFFFFFLEQRFLTDGKFTSYSVVLYILMSFYDLLLWVFRGCSVHLSGNHGHIPRERWSGLNPSYLGPEPVTIHLDTQMFKAKWINI